MIRNARIIACGFTDRMSFSTRSRSLQDHAGHANEDGRPAEGPAAVSFGATGGDARTPFFILE